MSTCDQPTCRRRTCDNRILHISPYGAPLDEDDYDRGSGFECPQCGDWYEDGSPFIVWMWQPSPAEVQTWMG